MGDTDAADELLGRLYGAPGRKTHWLAGTGEPLCRVTVSKGVERVGLARDVSCVRCAAKLEPILERIALPAQFRLGQGVMEELVSLRWDGEDTVHCAPEIVGTLCTWAHKPNRRPAVGDPWLITCTPCQRAVDKALAHQAEQEAEARRRAAAEKEQREQAKRRVALDASLAQMRKRERRQRSRRIVAWGCAAAVVLGLVVQDQMSKSNDEPVQPDRIGSFESGGDLDCVDIGREIWVGDYDPNHLDRDGDGWGCESYG